MQYKVLQQGKISMRALGTHGFVSFLDFFMDFIHPHRGGIGPHAHARGVIGNKKIAAAGFLLPVAA